MRKRNRSLRFLYVYRRAVASAMASPQTMLKGPHTTLLRLIHTPAVTRQKMVSVMSPRKAPMKNSMTTL